MQHLDDALIAEWVDGAIPPESPHHAAIAAHVDQCDECRVRVDEERALAGHVRQLLGVAAPPERVPPFAEVLHRAGSAPRRAASAGFPWRRLAWAATVVVAGGVGWYARGALIASGGSRPAAPSQVSREAAAAPANAALSEVTRVPPDAVAESPAVGGITLREEAVPAGRGAEAARAKEAVTDQVAAAEADAADERAAARRDAAAPAPAEAQPLAQVSPTVANELRAQTTAVHLPWTVTTRSDAERVLGQPLLSVRTLPIAGIDLASDSGAVRVRQPLGDGATLELVQFPQAVTDAAVGRAALAGADDQPRARPAPGAPSVLESVVEGVRVVVSGPVTLDSLRVLLGKTGR